MNVRIAALAMVVALGSASGLVEAKGCVKGAVVGGVAGHVAGNHGVAGAAVGCAIGHHREKVKANERAEQQLAAANHASSGRSRKSDDPDRRTTDVGSPIQ